MIDTSLAAAQAIESDSRRWNLILTDEENHVIESESGDIISMTHSIETSENGIVIGDLITQNVNIVLNRKFRGNFKIEQGTTFYMKYMLHDRPGSVPMGKFTIMSATKEKNQIKINAKDFFSSLDLTGEYSSELIYPAPLKEVIEEICSGLGIEIHLYEPLMILTDLTTDTYEKTYDKAGSQLFVLSDGADIDIHSLSEKTVGDALRACAAFMGVMLAQDRNGDLTCIRPSKVPVEISPSRAADPDFSADYVKIKRIECKVDDNTTLTRGEIEDKKHDRAIKFSCSVMPFEQSQQSEQMDRIFAYYNNLTYYPALINYILGDPRIDIFDIIKYHSMYEKNGQGELKTYSMPIMSMNYNFDGGLSCNLQSTANEKEKGGAANG